MGKKTEYIRNALGGILSKGDRNAATEALTIYFLNQNIGKYPTGIEHAAVRRMKLFKANNLEAKIVTAQYNCDLHGNIRNYGLQSENLLNLYDFFQDAVAYEEDDPETVETLCAEKRCRYTRVNETDYKLYDQDDKYLMYVRCAEKSGKLDYVNYFDANHKKIRRDFYDIRGFRSRTRFLADGEAFTHEIYYRPDGSTAMHKYYGQYNKEKSGVTLIELHCDAGIRYFYSEEEWIAFFLDCLVRASGDAKTVLICDRSRIYANALISMREKAAKVVVIHSRHKYDTNDGGYRINSNYRYIVEQLDALSALVLSTETQRQDFAEDFDAETPFFAIPVGYLQSIKDRPEDKIQKNKIINVARYSETKRLDHLIRAFDKIKDRFPDAELHLYGSGETIKAKLKDLCEQLNLSDRVFFRGYLYDLEPEYDSADLFVLSSSYEGFALVLLEAISHGLPIVAYDIKYGPKDMIADGVSGYLAESGNIDDLADKMAAVLSSESKKRAFGTQAARIAANFSETAVWEKWLTLLQTGTDPR
jgi:poly(glycerol-phosphate) alpha-glucosyltransferase